MSSLSVETSESNDFGPCDCCGAMSRTVWGYIHRDQRAEAAYFVQWTIGQIDRHGANFDVIIGRWGDNTGPSDRCFVALEFHRTANGPSFTVIDAAHRAAAAQALAGRALSRNEVIGTPTATLVFELVDAIWAQDSRIAEVTLPLVSSRA